MCSYKVHNQIYIQKSDGTCSRQEFGAYLCLYSEIIFEAQISSQMQHTYYFWLYYSTLVHHIKKCNQRTYVGFQKFG